MTEIVLRDYQRSACDALFAFLRNRPGNPLVVVPTGGGKSIILAEFIRGVREVWPATRFLVCTHVKELVEQNALKLEAMLPFGSGLGVYSAGLGRREADAPVLCAGVQSIASRADEIGHVDVVIVDEAHLIPKEGIGQYRTLLAGLRRINPKCRLVGLTATPFRTSGGPLHKGNGALFTDVAYEVRMELLIADGWLSMLRPKRVHSYIDTSGVKKRGREFVGKELEERALDSNIAAQVLEWELEANPMGRDGDETHQRKATLVFCCGVEHAHKVTDHFNEIGYTAKVVTGATPKKERDETIRGFRAGEFPVLVNVNVLTTGFDAPEVDCILCLRPTGSPVLYVQMNGRGMRVAPGKPDCLVLDFGQNVYRHGPVNLVDPRERLAGEGDPVRICPECDAIVHISLKACPHCGFVFPPPDETHDKRKASESELVVIPEPVWYDVESVEWMRHKKADKPDSVRVTYVSGFFTVSEWVLVGHSGFARRKAIEWCKQHGVDPAPESADELLVCMPSAFASRVLVAQEGKFRRIIEREFGDNPPTSQAAETNPLDFLAY